MIGINRFAFVIHPLALSFLHSHPLLGWTRYLPDRLLEEVAAFAPPMYLSKITGGVSPTTGQRIEGYLITLAATPRMMMKHHEHFTYKRLNQAARIAEKRGARIMGLGAFTSVVGDAGITVAHEADIAITSGNSLTVAATLEAGTVTPLPQPGNPKPRLFRLYEDAAVINRFGFNSEGLEPYVAKLKARERRGIARIEQGARRAYGGEVRGRHGGRRGGGRGHGGILRQWPDARRRARHRVARREGSRPVPLDLRR